MTVFGRDQEACHPTSHTTTPPAHARHPPLSDQQRGRPLNSTEDPQPGQALLPFAFPPPSVRPFHKASPALLP